MILADFGRAVDLWRKLSLSLTQKLCDTYRDLTSYHFAKTVSENKAVNKHSVSLTLSHQLVPLVLRSNACERIMLRKFLFLRRIISTCFGKEPKTCPWLWIVILVRCSLWSVRVDACIGNCRPTRLLHCSFVNIALGCLSVYKIHLHLLSCVSLYLCMSVHLSTYWFTPPPPLSLFIIFFLSPFFTYAVV